MRMVLAQSSLQRGFLGSGAQLQVEEGSWWWCWVRRWHSTGRTQGMIPGQLDGDGQVMLLCKADFYPKADG